jgi:hypothetical protein
MQQVGTFSVRAGGCDTLAVCQDRALLVVTGLTSTKEDVTHLDTYDVKGILECCGST